METIVLKKAAEEHIPDILKIIKKSFTQYAKEIGQEGKLQALKETKEDILNDISKKHVYICEIDGVTAGTVRFEIIKDGIAYLSRFAVDPGCQSIGIGGLLLDKVKEECRALGVRAITLFTASKMRSTVSFYLKNGYYIHSITRKKGYIRAFLVNELTPMDELFDYESIVGDR